MVLIVTLHSLADLYSQLFVMNAPLAFPVSIKRRRKLHNLENYNKKLYPHFHSPFVTSHNLPCCTNKNFKIRYRTTLKKNSYSKKFYNNRFFVTWIILARLWRRRKVTENKTTEIRE